MAKPALITGAELLRMDSGEKLQLKDLNPIPSIDKTYTADRIAALLDLGSCVYMNAAGANGLTIPPFATVPWVIGGQMVAIQEGAGATSIIAGTGVTILACVGNALVTKTNGGSFVLAGQLSGVHLRYRSLNLWHLFGTVTAGV